MSTFFSHLLLIATMAAYAAMNVTGKWAGEVQGQDAKHTITFTLNTEGDKVTGTEGRSNAADVPIQEGRLNGNTLTFVVNRDIGDRVLVLDYTGKVSDDKIDFVVKPRGNGWTTQFTATRKN
jgi:hypothetical protein